MHRDWSTFTAHESWNRKSELLFPQDGTDDLWSLNPSRYLRTTDYMGKAPNKNEENAMNDREKGQMRFSDDAVT